MANIASQIKRNRQNEKRRLRNKSVRAELRTRTKNAVTAATNGAEDSVEQLRLAVKRIDKAAARGVIHKNTAANHKSRLVRRVAAIEAATAAAYEPADDEVDEEVESRSDTLASGVAARPESVSVRRGEAGAERRHVGPQRSRLAHLEVQP